MLSNSTDQRRLASVNGCQRNGPRNPPASTSNISTFLQASFCFPVEFSNHSVVAHFLNHQMHDRKSTTTHDQSHDQLTTTAPPLCTGTIDRDWRQRSIPSSCIIGQVFEAIGHLIHLHTNSEVSLGGAVDTPRAIHTASAETHITRLLPILPHNLACPHQSPPRDGCLFRAA